MSAITLERPTSSYATPAPDDVVETTAAALRARGFEVRIADDREQARELVLGLIPSRLGGQPGVIEDPR